jgi:uncharacterized iron-regulated membrane protein
MQAQSRQWLVITHRWLGLSLLLWFVMLGVTGSVLVFQDEIDAWLNPALLIDSEPHESDRMQSAQTILESALRTFPEAAVERIRMPQRSGEVFRLVLRERARIRIGSPRFEATFSPTNSASLGARPLYGYGVSAPMLVRTIYDLHHRVLLGNAGKTAVGVIGALLLVMISLGFLIALPRKLVSRAWATMVGIKLGSHPARLIFDLHRSIGVIAFGLLLISTFTGFALAFPDYARDALSLFSGTRTLPVVPFIQREDLPDAPLDPLLAAARSAHPGAQITEVHLPQRRSAPLLIYLQQPGDWQRRGDTLLMIDSATGVLKLEHDARSRSLGEQVFHSLFPIHSGVAWGTIGRFLMFVAGLLPLCLGITGVLIWRRKQRATAVARSRKLRTMAR